jgi:nucleoside-diphosphate-sugar epimerase
MDAVDAMALLFEKSNLLSGGFVSIDLGSGKSVSMFEVANFIHSELNCNKELGFGDLAMREHDESDLFADLKFLENLGWKPKIEIWKGLRVLLADVLRKVKY